MPFNYYSYLLVLVLIVSVFWALPVKIRRWYLIAVSIAFYAAWTPQFVFVPLAIALGVFLCVRELLADTAKRLWFRLGIVFVLSLLIFFRYHELLAACLDTLFEFVRLHPGQLLFAVGVPLGISFYSFEAISFLIDARQKRIKQVNFSDVCLYLMFWPNVVSGPIARWRELVPQFSFNRAFELNAFISGLDRIVLGLVQKNLIADNLNSWVKEGFLPQGTQANTTLDNWFLGLAFALQIYFDFAAYSNMAIGTAKLIGINLPENFHFPYHAKNPSDFWSRWHMTLSRWIRDYLFFPVNARFQGATLPLYASLIGVMALVGLWHGAGLGFVIWGVLHGCYLVAYRGWETLRSARWPHLEKSRTAGLAWQAATLVAVLVAWVPFRAESLHQAVTMLRSMFFGFSFRISYSVNFYLVTLLVAAYCIAEPYLADVIAQFDKSAIRNARLMAANLYLARPLVYAFGLLLFFAFDERNIQFIYFQF